MKTFHYLLLARRQGVTLFVFLLIVGNARLLAQDREWPINVSVFNQQWAFPYYEPLKITPIHPGLEVGISCLKKDKLFCFPQSANLGYFYNTNAGSALFLQINQSIRFSPKCGFFADISLGVGYMHAFHPRDIYRKEDGIYKKVTDFGKPSIMFSFAQTFGYDFSKKHQLPIAPFIKYQWFASSPYFDMIFPIRPNSLTHIGTIIYF